MSQWLTSLGALTLVLILLTPVVNAAPLLPHSFYGTLKINDHDAPTGTEITTSYDGGACGNYTTTEDGKYGDNITHDYLLVQHTDIREGDTIYFFIDGVNTTQTEPYAPSGKTVLNLTVSISNYLASYQDAAHTTSCDDFASYETQHTVYVYGTGFSADDYKVAYYDGSNTRVDTEEATAASGELSSQRTFNEGVDVAGTWHVIVCVATHDPPNSYDANWADTLASDSFDVQVAAVSGCFIATAAYGSYLDSHVNTLRSFRDQYLMMNPMGRSLVYLYYKLSPPVAEFIKEHPVLKPLVRVGLLPAVAMSTVAVNTSLAGKITIVGLLALVSIVLATWARKRRAKVYNIIKAESIN